MMRFIVILGLLVLCVCTAIAQEAPQYGQEEVAIRRLDSHMSRLSIGVTGVRVKGRDKIEAALEKFF